MNTTFHSISASILLAALAGGAGIVTASDAHAVSLSIQQTGVLRGKVMLSDGTPASGASVLVIGTTNGANADDNGTFSIQGVKAGANIRISYIGCKTKQVKWDGKSSLDITLEEETGALGEVVVTAMGIARKASSLTYSTQQIKSDDFMRVQDANLVNAMEGKISGITLTPSAGGAGGATKIVLRGNKSIQGSNSPLIVVDGVPMTNNTRSQVTSGAKLATEGAAEGSDPLSMINPDDIESINVLKGANAAALYGSAAANGVLMITTKRGREGRLDINFTSNVTFDTPLLTPEIQDKYGATISTNGLSIGSWGNAMGGTDKRYTLDAPMASNFGEGTYEVHLRDRAENDIANFYRTGYTTNNSISLSGGTERSRSYFSYANSHAEGMVMANIYNRNTFAFRQNFKLWDRITIDANANYVVTRSAGRVGGGTVGNPIYDLYTMPRNIDLAYYRDNYSIADGTWYSADQTYYPQGAGAAVTGKATLHGGMQNWAFQTPGKNNPYWLRHMNRGEIGESRFYASIQGRIDIYDGLAFQARVSYDHSDYTNESHKTATTWDPASLNDYGRYWLNNSQTNEIYTDYLLSYNKTFSQDWNVNATAGWVGHTIKGTIVQTDAKATIDMTKNGILTELPTVINYFEPNAGGPGATTKRKTSNWDKAALFTAQVGWKDMIYVDGSYRRDWYRAFKQFSIMGTPDNYGYFGFGANAILSRLLGMDDTTYLKYRISYSEVGNSIPNNVFAAIPENLKNGTAGVGQYIQFYPYPEKTKSFETGAEMSFFGGALTADITYYNSALHNSYITIPALNGKTQPVNTGLVRNQGVELTVGYDWLIGNGWRWKTSANFSLNDNKIVKTYSEKGGAAQILSTSVANGVQVRYIEGGKYGDMYVNDFTRWRDDVYQYVVSSTNEQGDITQEIRYSSDPSVNGGDNTLIHKAGDVYVNSNGMPSFDGNLKYINKSGTSFVTQRGEKYSRYLGNMNSNVQLSWSNSLYYKDFSLYFLISGRIGGKVISLTEAYLDRLGLSQRTAAARDKAIAEGIYYADGVPGMYINEGRDLVPIQQYYEILGTDDASSYVYDATNFRLRELSLGYTFRDLFGNGKSLSLSVIARNLFFIYKDAPVDPDVSLSTANGLGGFEMFNLPAARSFGVNLKLNF